MSEFENNCFLYLKTTSVLHCIALQWVFFLQLLRLASDLKALRFPLVEKHVGRGPTHLWQSFEHCCWWEILLTEKLTSLKGTCFTVESEVWNHLFPLLLPSGPRLVWEKHRIILLQLLGKPVGDIMPRVDPTHVHHDCSQLVLQRRWFKIQPDMIYQASW